MDTIRQLKTEFDGKGEVRGYKFRQISATNSGFLYEVTSDHRKYYEVFKKRVNKQYGVMSYPRSKSFGKWAWCFMDLTKAKNKLKELEDEHRRKTLV